MTRLRERLQRSWIWLAYLALSGYFTAPLLTTGGNLGISDWDVILLYHASVFRSVYEYAQLPFWNPWYCGGNVLWQNPQVPLVTPVYFLALVTSLPFAMKLTIFLFYLVGFAGMHLLLTRVFRISFQPAVLCLASLFVLAGGPAFHFTVGHATFLPYFYLPWLLFFFVRAIESGRLRFVVGASAVVALTLYAGGIHIAAMSGVALGLFAVVAAITRRDWRPVALVGLVGVLAALFAAPKLLPTGLFLANPNMVDIRGVSPREVTSLDILLHAFLDPFQYLRESFHGQTVGWHEYGNYIGSFGLLLIVAAFVSVIVDRPWRREHWLGLSLAVTAAALLSIALGEWGPYAPYSLLEHLPVFGRFRVPTRYLLVFALFAVSLVAWALRGLSLASGRESRLVRYAGILLVVASVFLAYRNRIPLSVAFPLSPLEQSFAFMASPPAPAIDARTNGEGGDSPMLREMMAGREILRCYEPFVLRGAVQPRKPVVFAEGGVTVSRIAFTPDRIRFGAVSSTGGRVYLNQRYAPGWRSSAGPIAVDPATQLAYVTLPPGAAAMYAFSFRPPGLITGLVLFAIGVLLSWLGWNWTLAAAKASNAPPPAVPQS